MSGDQFKTPLNKSRLPVSLLQSTATKRDSLAAELERDPHLSTAKRHQRAQVFTSSLSHAHLERQLLASQTAKVELETKLKEKELLVERLERDRRWFADREKEEREEKEKERAENDQAKRKVDAENRALRTSNSSLQQELADLRDAHSALSRTTNQTITSQKTQVTSLTHRVALVQEECDQFKRLADERNSTIHDLQRQYDDLNANQEAISRKASDDESMAVVREELHRQASYLRNLESTNAKLNAELGFLRERHTSVEVLREEKRGLEQKVSMLEELRTRIITLEAEVAAGRQEREQWANMSVDAKSSGTPVSITQTLSDLRLTHARLLEEHGAAMALLRQRETQIDEYERREVEMQDTISSLQQELRTTKAQATRREARAALAERETSFLQALLASFNSEAEADLGMDTADRIDRMKTTKIERLEELLSEYKATNEQLQNELDKLGGPSMDGRGRREFSEELEKAHAEKVALQNDLDNANSEMKVHLDKIEDLEQTLFELRGEVAGGRHVPPGVRILSLKDNPEQQWFDLRQAALDRLRSENEALMKRLKDLEDSGMRSSGTGGENREDLVPRESWDLVNKEKNDLEDLVKQKEKRLLRLQQVFTSKSAEFREAIASILGVKLAFYPNGSVRVTSIYDLCASFVFQPASKSDGAKMQLVAQGEGGPQDLPSLMHYWIENEQCIPGFLASVTLECYDKSKRDGEGGEEVSM